MSTTQNYNDTLPPQEDTPGLSQTTKARVLIIIGVAVAVLSFGINSGAIGIIWKAL